MSFQIPYVYNYITKLCRQEAQIIQNHEHIHVRNIGQGEAKHRNYKTLKLGGCQVYDRSNDYKLVLQSDLLLIEHNLLYRTCTKRDLVYVLYIQNYRYISCDNT
jgi:hypothetical protein